MNDTGESKDFSNKFSSDEENGSEEQDLSEAGSQEAQEYSSDTGNGGSGPEERTSLRDVDLSTSGISAAAGSLDKKDEQIRDLQDKYLRALADFENFKKRTVKERSDLLKYQGERIFVDILEVVDNLELALQHSEGDVEKFKEGIDLIQKRFHAILEKWEVRSEPAVGKKFDPNHHSAISQVPSPDTEPGTVVNELKRAYFYKDRLLRVAEVVVASAPIDH